MLRIFTFAVLMTLAAPVQACPAPSGADLHLHLATLNAQRSQAGQAPLEFAPDLGRVAQAHACDMARRGYFSHTSPDGRGMMARAQQAGLTGYCAMGENIAKGQPDVPSVMASWMRSTGHRRNILDGGFTHVGFGRAPGAHWVQLFAGRC